MMIGQYFDQRRGLANGLGMAGNSVGGIVIPLVADALMDEYGLRGAMLIMGGILLNGCVGIMLWQPVEWHVDPTASSDTDVTDNKSSSLVASYSVDFLPSVKEYDQRRTSLTFSFQSSCSIPELSKLKDFETISKASSFMYLSTYHVGPSSSTLLTKDHIKLPEEKEEEAESMIDSKSIRSEKESIAAATSSSSCCRPRCRISQIIDTSFFSDAAFYVLTFSMMCHYFSYPGTQMFLPLRATSLGLSQAQGASLLSALAFADLIGRIGCAWISDFHLFPRKYWFIVGILLAGVFAICLQFPKDYALLLACSAGFGLASGAYIGLMIALFADTFGGNRVAVAYSLANMTSGFVTISGPPLMVSKFTPDGEQKLDEKKERDCYILESTGSYAICQIILGSVQILGASIWVLEPWAVGRQKSRRESALNKA
ncbi:hypothetical protein LAZ67_18001806 [Cordylochernes scorpioides]|uniref:Uncharacterized protein n=1 Tax=Cordylochernes scorpioides TaxID=51811 RepID=A0ABY6LI83_9ARAC|nr:hypothetical protein LAZ67_18001806 [Cordylochernes scorpioides]